MNKLGQLASRQR